MRAVVVEVIRRSLDEIRQRAIRELCANDTISVYTMWDDYEDRRIAPYAQLRLALSHTVDSLGQLVLGVENFSRALDLEIGGRA